MRALFSLLFLLVALSWFWDNIIPIARTASIDFSSIFLGAFGAAVVIVVLLRFFQHRWVDAETAEAIRKVKEAGEKRKW